MAGNGLTPFAWAFMLLSMGAVTWLTVWAYYRILTSGTSDAAPEGASGGTEPGGRGGGAGGGGID